MLRDFPPFKFMDERATIVVVRVATGTVARGTNFLWFGALFVHTLAPASPGTDKRTRVVLHRALRFVDTSRCNLLVSIPFSLVAFSSRTDSVSQRGEVCTARGAKLGRWASDDGGPDNFRV